MDNMSSIMKHIPTVLLVFCLLSIGAVAGMNGYNLFVVHKSELVFGSPKQPAAINKKQPDKVITSQYLTGEQLWENVVKNTTNPEIDNIVQRIKFQEEKLKTNPKNKDAINALSYYALKSGNTVQSQRYYEKILAFEPDDKSSQLGIAYIYLLLKNYNNSETILENMLEKFPDDPKVLMCKGFISEKKGNKQAAKTYYTKSLLKNPSNLAVQVALNRIK